jgi:hypothetical protein
MKELKPCPFCGSPAELRERENMNPQGGKQYNVRCSNPSCICKPLAWRRDRIEIMTLWNIRAVQTDCSWGAPNGEI